MSWCRILLLLVLSITLPVRGVMAAALLCPPHAGAGAGGQAHVATPAHAGGGAHHAGDAGAADLAATAAPPCHAQDNDTGTDTCHLCSACCSVPPLPSTAPVVPQPQVLAATVFPPFAAPAPTFQSEGPERPPRSI